MGTETGTKIGSHRRTVPESQVLPRGVREVDDLPVSMGKERVLQRESFCVRFRQGPLRVCLVGTRKPYDSGDTHRNVRVFCVRPVEFLGEYQNKDLI